MRIGVAGDWHGDLNFAGGRVFSLGSRGVTKLFQLGDFGFIWGGPQRARWDAELDQLEKVCARKNVTIYVTPGNHDDWRQILDHPLDARDDVGEVAWFRDHVAVIPRGHRFEIAGRTFVSLGGAPSVDWDRKQQPGVDWWPEEMIPQEVVDAVADAGHASVMLTHDSPGAPYQCPRVATICETDPWGWGEEALAYAAVGRDRMTTAFEGVKPDLLIHGHYHVQDETNFAWPDGRSCRVASTGAAQTSRDGKNSMLLDTDSLELAWL